MINQPTPLTDAQPTIAQYEPKPVTRFVAVDFARALERRMRAAEALLVRVVDQKDDYMSRVNDAKAHLAAAQAMDAGGDHQSERRQQPRRSTK